jgi:Mn2+/Fe2+ NRAMP family transporter
MTRKAKSERASGTKPRLVTVLGPGLITGASDDDPSGIATYSQAGAQFGFAVSWTLLFSYPLMTAIQEISARIGRTTGRGIAANIRIHYSNWVHQGALLERGHQRRRRGAGHGHHDGNDGAREDHG